MRGGRQVDAVLQRRHGAAVGPGGRAAGSQIEHGDSRRSAAWRWLGNRGRGFLDGSLPEARRDGTAGGGRPGRTGTGRRATPASDTGCSPTHRARTAHPAGHSEQLVNFARISPRAGRGMPGQFSDHSAVSVIRRHGAGVNSAPTAAPPANLKRSLRESLVICGSPGNCVPAPACRWQATQSSMVMAGCPACPQMIAGVAADAVLLVARQLVAGALRAVALFALHVAPLHVRDVREVDVLGLARVGQPIAARGWASRTAR